MLTDDVIDEDIEALLYAQIHYGPQSESTEDNIPLTECESSNVNLTSADLEDSTAIHSTEEIPNVVHTDENCSPNEAPINSLNDNFDQTTHLGPDNQQEIIEKALLVTSLPSPDSEITTESLLKSPDTSTIKSTIGTSSVPNDPTKFASSNITINQYIYPDSQFWDSLKTYRHIWSNRCTKDLKRVQKGKLDEKKFFKVLNSRLRQWNKNFKKQEQIRKAVFKKRRRIAASEIVCLSDSDNSDVEFVSIEEPKKDSMKEANIVNIQDSNGNSSSNGDDDEIIYVEPPPVPIIHVDDESHDEEERIKETQPQEAEECSNDFLVLTATPETFNFSLHDSEFQETEFPRPAMPCPTYETESSTTSTSEFNKDGSQMLNRSFKTIVFNEIDFPKEDIFDGNNLDTFGDLIAPTGMGNPEIGGVVTEAAMGKIDSNCSAADRTASDSGTSSESDYEVPKSIEKSLPDLCPIKITHDQESFKKNSSKAGSVDESFGGESGISESSVTLGKGKGKSDGEMEESFGKKKLKKKKKLPGSKIDNSPTILEGLPDGIGIISLNASNSVLTESCKESSETAKKKNKKKKKVAEILEKNEIGKPTKRRKSNSIKVGAEDQSVNETELQGEEDINKKKKRRKQKSNEAMEQAAPQQSEEVVGEPVSDEINVQKANKKKKRNVSEKPQQNIDVAEDEKASVNEKEVDEDVILIEKVIPTHTIDSSESDNDDIITFEDIPAEVELANISSFEINKLQNKKQFNCSINWSNSIEFDVQELQNKMSDDPEKWKILPVDYYPLSVRKKGPRCNKCRQFGHIALSCPNKPCIPSCTMCGFQGHMEPRCPNTLCLTCAKPGSYTTVACRKCVNQMNSATCYICKLAGHVSNSCPDLWRRYSMTTTEGNIVRRKKKLIPRNKQWCSGCASQGHLEHECASNKWIRQYPASSPMIFNYSNVYPKPHTGVRGNVDLRRKVVDKRNNRQCNSAMQANQEIVVYTEVGNAQSGTGEASRSVILQEISTEHLPDAAGPPTLAPSPPLPQSTFNAVEVRHEIIPENAIDSNISPPGCEPLLLNSRSRRRALRKHKINPFSVVNSQRKYSSYQPMLNPYSMLGFNNARAQNIPFRLENKRATDLNSLQSSGLFNSVPSEVLAQQVLNLTSSMAATYQRNDQNIFNGPELNFEPPSPPIISFSPSDQSLNFVNGTAPQLEERYQDYITYQRRTNYLDRPYTITREEPNEYGERQNFIDRRDMSKSLRFDNVEEMISKKFIQDPMFNLKEFIGNELEKLGNIKNHEAKLYKKKLNNIDQLKKIEVKTNSVKKQIYFNYKHINMYLFGTERLAQGKYYLDFLRNFVLHPGCKDLRDNKRRALLEAYGYIFGGEHPNFNYRKFLNHLTLGFRQRR